VVDCGLVADSFPSDTGAGCAQLTATMATYYGSSEHGIDDKGRLTLPARILDEVPKSQWKFHLTAGLDRCLLLHDAEGFQELVNQIGRAVPGSRAHRALCRRFLGHSEAVVPDGNRRIRVPEPLLKYAGLGASQPVVLVGTGRVCELWSPSQLDVALAEASPEEEQLFSSLVGPTTPATPADS
jgi:division/cell wall cluster transcriptional repressor MraZ